MDQQQKFPLWIYCVFLCLGHQSSIATKAAKWESCAVQGQPDNSEIDS